LEKIDLLIFDLDGTLVDSLDDIVQSVNHTLAELRFDALSKSEIRSFVGDGIRNLLLRSLHTRTESADGVIARAEKIYWDHHEVHCLDHVRVYPHVEDVLDYFSAKKKAVISNKSEHFTKKILNALHVAAYFDIILGGDSLPEKKPSPMPVNHILKSLRIEKQRAVIIGDGPQDLACGKAAGIRTCGVTYGFRSRQEVEGADFVVDDLKDVTKLYC
jgi:phosphoglycolate phosphatase